jgi:hypothetical protein
METPDFILIEKTIQKFGYDPRNFKGQKDYKKIILRTCFICKNEYEQSFINAVRASKLKKKCKYCSNKENSNKKIKERSIKLKEKYASGEIIHPMLGKTHTNDVKEILRNKLLGKSYEERFGEERANEIKSKLSDINLGEKNKFYGKRHSEETIDKMRETHKKTAKRGKDCNFYGISYSKLMTNDEFIKKCQEKHNNFYNYDLTIYQGRKKSIIIICPIHGSFSQIASDHLYCGCGCQKCNRSKGEIKIESILEKLNINFITQYKFHNCKNKNKLPFDFYLPEFNCCIEYDGEFHFIDMGFNNLVETKMNDDIKSNFCQSNSINLIRINYNEFNEIEKILNENLQR